LLAGTESKIGKKKDPAANDASFQQDKKEG
jgi:hypothetical protein